MLPARYDDDDDIHLDCSTHNVSGAVLSGLLQVSFVVL